MIYILNLTNNKFNNLINMIIIFNAILEEED